MESRDAARKPVVGVTPLYDVERQSVWMIPGYLDVLQACGALPLVLPFNESPGDARQLAGLLDGVLFTGGPDVNPALYGEERLEACGEPLPARDGLESLWLGEAVRRDMPVFGICRGIQLMNVLWGGALYQDLPSQRPSELVHRMRPPYDRVSHQVELVDGSPLRGLLGVSELGVNSYHHQGIRELAPGLEPMARASDGLVEAVRSPSMRFCWAVQWHPELSWRADPLQKRLVQAFVDACAAV